MKIFSVFAAIVLVSFSSFANASLDELGVKIGSGLGEDMQNFFESFSHDDKNPLQQIANDISSVDNQTLQLVRQSLERAMSDESAMLEKKTMQQVRADSVIIARTGKTAKGKAMARGLSSYSKIQSDAVLTFIELFYRGKEKPNIGVKDFLFIFKESGVPFMNQLRSSLGAPGFSARVPFCKALLGPEVCYVK